MSRDWDPDKHPRDPDDGRFTETWAAQAVARLWRPRTHNELADLVKRDDYTESDLAGGSSSHTRLYTYSTGERVVHKTAFGQEDEDFDEFSRDDYEGGYGPPPGEENSVTWDQLDAIQQAENETIASLIGRAIGAPVPAAVYDHSRRDSIYMDYVPGRTAWAEFQHRNPRGRHTEFYQMQQQLAATDQGRLLGLLDLLIGNGDRNGNNWIIDPDGRIWGIDHAHSFDQGDGGGVSDFADPIMIRRLDPDDKIVDFHPDDAREAARRIAELRPAIDRPGVWPSVNDMLDTLEQLARHGDPDAPRRIL